MGQRPGIFALVYRNRALRQRHGDIPLRVLARWTRGHYRDLATAHPGHVAAIALCQVRPDAQTGDDQDFQDNDGARLDPKHRYTLRFPPGGLPPVDAFWSLTAYTAEDLNLIANPIDRYSVGDHASQLRMDGDGGLTLYLQPDPPAGERESSWSPTSPGTPWFVILRMYRPGAAALNGSWRCPGISRAD